MVAAAHAASDPVAQLDARLARGEATLAFHPRWGYLPSLLDELSVPRSSQLLVFSKTSAQFRLISPRAPRAIYFNDDTYVGWVPGGRFLEISTAVPRGTAAFYTLAQEPTKSPRLILDNGACLQCHESRRTLGVPGHLTRSVYPAPDGLPYFNHGTVDVDHTTPISARWGGWFVTGRIPMRHRGNAVGPDGGFSRYEAGLLAQSPYDFFDPDAYLTPHSDVVAHLVLAHQTRVHNAIARAGDGARTALAYREEMIRLFGTPSESLLASVKRRIERPSEELVRDLLLADEAPLTGPVESESGFAAEFQKRDGTRVGIRSLRELDLNSRLFRYPLSFLIQSTAYRELPDRVQRYVERRIAEVADGRDQSGAFPNLKPSDREALQQLLARISSQQ